MIGFSSRSVVTRLEKVEEQIRALSRPEFASFLKWHRRFEVAVWDREFEEDAKAGKLDAIADAALKAHRSGKSTPM